MPHFVTRLAASFACTLFADAACAARGDIDPGFESSSQLAAGSYTSSRSDDTIFVTHVENTGFRVARFDANGRPDAAYGTNGAVIVTLPVATPYFTLVASVVAPDGALLLAGTMTEASGRSVYEILVRIDAAGHLDSLWAGSGDGIRRLSNAPVPRTSTGVSLHTLAGLAVDRNGNTLLARRNGAAVIGSCTTTAAIERLSPAGTPDRSFGTAGRAELTDVTLCGNVQLLAVRSDGTVIVAGDRSIVALDPSGRRDSTFGSGGRADVQAPTQVAAVRLLPDERLIIADSGDYRVPGPATLLRLTRDGRPDASYGSGAGLIRVDLGAILLGEAGTRQNITELEVVPGSTDLLLHASIFHTDGTPACGEGIVRLGIDGTPDPGFGRGGLTCLHRYFDLFAVQHSGAPLFHTQHEAGGDDHAHRLLATSAPSPGIIVASPTADGAVDTQEKAGKASATFLRTAGYDGAIGVGFATRSTTLEEIQDRVDTYGLTFDVAIADADYRTVAGRLSWADREAGAKAVDVPIIDDTLVEGHEYFAVQLADPSGGALLLEDAFTMISIEDDDFGVAAPTASAPTPSAGGGGGSTSGLAVLVLLGALAVQWRPMRLRRTWPDQTPAPALTTFAAGSPPARIPVRSLRPSYASERRTASPTRLR